MSTVTTPPAPHRARYEVVVAGGGPAGAAAAAVLARAGRRVLLADAGTGPPKTVESLPGTARLLLADLGLPAPTPGPAALPCYARHTAWGSSVLHTVDLLLDPHGHAWQLDRPRFDHALRRAAAAAGADLAEGTTVRRPVRHGAEWRLTLTTGTTHRTVRCRWLVDATGRRAALAVRCGARRRVRDALVGLLLTLPATPEDQDGSSLVESEPDGWWYTALHPAGRRLLAHFTDADLPGAALRTGAAARHRLAATRHVSRRVPPRRLPADAVLRRVAAHTAHLDTAHGEGWVAAGDAALALDPLSSQGVLTALYTGMRAGQAVDAELRGERDAAARHTAAVRQAHHAYLREHRAVHADETRWRQRPFWSRRQPAPRLGTPAGHTGAPPGGTHRPDPAPHAAHEEV